MSGNFQTKHIAIQACLQTGNATILKSDPGLGKSRYIYSLADAADRFIGAPVIGSRCDQTDFGGIPYNDNGKMRLSTPWFVQEVCDQDRPAVVFYDEVSNTPRNVLGSMLDGIQTGRWGAGRLPRFTWQPMAMNPTETAADGTELPAPFSNRAFHFDWKPTAKDFVRGMQSGWQQPEFTSVRKTWEVGIQKWRAIVAGYINAKPADYHVLPEEEGKRSGAWPSPRSWDDLVCQALAALDSMYGSVVVSKDAKSNAIDNLRDVQLAIVSAAVGYAYALQFFGWMDSLELPDLEEILKKPSTFEPHYRGDINFTVLSGIAQIVAENPTDERYLAGWDVMHVAAEKKLVDVACTAARTLALLRRKMPKLPTPKTQLVPFIKIMQKAGMLDKK
ncbi:hypothetical protein L0244_24145 [bacterium]|nr:hypothetical protein [bacterium]